MLDPRGRVHGKPMARRQCEDRFGCAFEIETAGKAEDDILSDRERPDQHEFLMDHADAVRDRLAGTADGDRSAVDKDLAFLGLMKSVEDLHQRALAGPVLAE